MAEETDMEKRLTIEVSNLRSRNEVLSRQVHRLEIECSQMVREIAELRTKIKGHTS